MSSTETYGEYHRRVAKVRMHLELSQEEMAQRVGFSLRGYANYERGERAIPVDLVLALYHHCSVDPVWLLTGEGSMTIDKEVRNRLDQRVLDRVVTAVERFEDQSGQSMKIRHKARLIGLLYEQTQLLSEAASERQRGDLTYDAQLLKCFLETRESVTVSEPIPKRGACS
jgi:transcriptional regulator with XRE-family HTH domain